jgi:hypothetical protein
MWIKFVQAKSSTFLGRYFGVDFMPDHGFRKTNRRRIGIVRNGRTLSISPVGRSDRPVEGADGEAESPIRMEKVRMAKMKIAMGIYDDPVIWEQTLDNMAASLS